MTCRIDCAYLGDGTRLGNSPDPPPCANCKSVELSKILPKSDGTPCADDIFTYKVACEVPVNRPPNVDHYGACGAAARCIFDKSAPENLGDT